MAAIKITVFLVSAACLFGACTFGQRSGYAPSPVVYPNVLPQYTSPPPSDVDNRFGGGSTTTEHRPLVTDSGSLYPIDQLNWIYNEWPKDKIPFNVANSQYLLNHRNSIPQSQQPPVNTRGSFTG